MSDDPRVTVPAELVDALREAWTTYIVASVDPNRQKAMALSDAARALVDAAERPAAPVSEPLCQCGHEVGLHYMQPGEPPTCIYCGCTESGRKSLAPVPVSDEAEANESFEDELDAHIAESMKDPEYAAADALHREAEASWRNWVPSMFADDENMHTAYVAGYKDSDAGFRAARQAGKDEQP